MILKSNLKSVKDNTADYRILSHTGFCNLYSEDLDTIIEMCALSFISRKTPTLLRIPMSVMNVLCHQELNHWAGCNEVEKTNWPRQIFIVTSLPKILIMFVLRPYSICFILSRHFWNMYNSKNETVALKIFLRDSPISMSLLLA
jgi:hypothetical protein